MEKIQTLPNKIENFAKKNKTSYWIYNFVIKLSEKMKKTNFNLTPSYLAYSLLLSFIPMLIFLTQAITFFGSDIEGVIFDAVSYLPESTSKFVVPLLKEIFSGKSTGLSVLALFSWVWLGSRGFTGLVQTINEIFDTNQNRGPIFEKIFGVVYLIGFTLILVALLIFNVFKDKILYLIEEYTAIESIAPEVYDFFINGFTSIMPLLMMTVMFLFFYKFAPATDKHSKVPIKQGLIGAAFTAVAITVITIVYSYTQNLSKMNVYYGAMAGILALLVWLLMICQAIIFGAILIATLMEMKNTREERHKSLKEHKQTTSSDDESTTTSDEASDKTITDKKLDEKNPELDVNYNKYNKKTYGNKTLQYKLKENPEKKKALDKFR